MPIGSGLSSQLGDAEESTFGTAVTVDRFYEYRPPASLKMTQDRVESQAIRTGQLVLRSDRYALGKKDVKGDITKELVNKGLGRDFKHSLGSVATSQPDSGGNPTVYLHTFTPGELPTGRTFQVGRPDTSGTVRPFTYPGCKVASWELASAVGEIATFKQSLIGRDEDTVTALAVASYASSLKLLTFINGTLTIAGSGQDVKSISVTGKNTIDENRYFLGSALRKNPLSVGLRDYGGTMEAEFESLTAYNRYVNGTEASLVLLFQGDVISTTYSYQLKVTANVRFDGDTPEEGMAITKQTLPFKVTDTGSLSIKFEFQTTDATP